MPRAVKSKPKLSLLRKPSNSFNPVCDDDLPPFQPFLDITITGMKAPNLNKYGKNARVFYVKPTKAEVVKAERLGMKLYGATNTRLTKNLNVNQLNLYDNVRDISTIEFAEEIVRVHILYVKNLKKSDPVVSKSLNYFFKFVKFVISQGVSSVYHIDQSHWFEFKSFLQKNLPGVDHKLLRERFNKPKEIFLTFLSGNEHQALENVKSPNPIVPKLEPKEDKKGVFTPKEFGYSDEVMYQALSIFLYEFNLHFDCRYKYLNIDCENITCFIDPALIANKSISTNYNEHPDIPPNEFQILLVNILKRDDYCTILYENKLLYMKLGLNEHPVKRARKYIYKRQPWFNKQLPNATKLLDKYAKWEEEHICFEKDFMFMHSKTVGYGNKPRSSKEKVLRRVERFLLCITCIYTGLNKEVVLSWPSMVDGKSILVNHSNLFVSKNSELDKQEIEITGIKAKTGIVDKKEVSCTIDKSSLLYELLSKYETYFKTDFSGNFFESLKQKNRPPYSYFEKRKYEIRDKDGSIVSPWDTTKYRKVFATGKLINELGNVKGVRELAEHIRDSLHHERLDITISHYLMKTNKMNTILDIAITTITNSKLEEAIKFQGKIGYEMEDDKTRNQRKKVFLCDCDDPTSPSHELTIADECSHYDMCLGCKRSTVFEIHLPYICARIIQYEDFQKNMGNEWDALFEDKWMIAQDALNTYARTQKNGDQIVKHAWIKARNISLPPILMRV